MNFSKKSNHHYFIASVKNNLLQSNHNLYMNALKEQEKIAKSGENYKYRINLNKRLSRLKTYQKFKDEIENQHLSNSQMELDHKFKDSFNLSTNSLPPLKKRTSIVLSPQKNEYNVFKVQPNGNLKLAEKKSQYSMKEYLNKVSENEQDKMAQSQQFERASDLKSRISKLTDYVSTEFEGNYNLNSSLGSQSKSQFGNSYKQFNFSSEYPFGSSLNSSTLLFDSSKYQFDSSYSNKMNKLNNNLFDSSTSEFGSISKFVFGNSNNGPLTSSFVDNINNNTSSKNTKLVSPIKSSLFENSLKLQSGLNSSLDFLDNSNIFKTQFDFIEPK